MQIRQYQESDREAVIELWNESSPSQAPHNDPATAIRKKCEVQRELFFVALQRRGADQHGKAALLATILRL